MLGASGPLALLFVQCGGGGSAADGDDIALPGRTGGGLEGGATDAPRSDSSTTVDIGDAGSPRCDPTKPFGTPVRLADFEPNAPRSTPRLAPDELTIYFTTNAADAGSDISMAARASAGAPFTGETILAQSGPSNDNDPMVAADQQSLWFHSTRNGTADIFVATRSGSTGPFGTAATIPTVDQPNTNENHAYFRLAGDELWFISDRAGPAGSYDIYVSKRTGASYAAPTRVAELSSPSQDWQPQPSEDGRTILFASDRDGGLGQLDLWVARRASTAVPFEAPMPLTELNSPAIDQAGWLSADGCRIWFSSGRATSDAHQQIFFAQRPL